ncbi:MAG: porin [Sutterellaceae bacterium]|nr:porin [Sutterellaceae bacterium]MDY2867376.1 porin [Mesosutterella sp.]
MKKLAVAAALSAALCCTAASAAPSVTLYGLMDTGFSLARTGGNDPAKAGDGNVSLRMKSGQRNGSRFGLKGTEDLGGGYKVGFILEDQFKGDDGTLQDSSFWARESTVWVSGGFGRVWLGKTGQLKSPVGSTALAGTIMYPFGTLMGNFVGGLKYITAGNYLTVNNSITYRTPDWNGLTLNAQYSFAMNKQEGTGMNDDDRYMALAARYRAHNLVALALVDTIHRNTAASATTKDQWTYTLGANYDFGYVKPYVYAQYFRSANLNAVGADYKGEGHNISASGAYSGYGVLAAIQWPMWGGKAKVGGGYMHANGTGKTENDVRRYSAHVGYDYPLSKRTDLYWDLGWVRQNTSAPSKPSIYQDGTELAVGMVHRF